MFVFSLIGLPMKGILCIHTSVFDNTHTCTERGVMWMGKEYLRESRDNKYHINETDATSLCSSFSIFVTTFFPPAPCCHIACTPAPLLLPLYFFNSPCALSRSHLRSLVIYHLLSLKYPPTPPFTHSFTLLCCFSFSCKTLLLGN